MNYYVTANQEWYDAIRPCRPYWLGAAERAEVNAAIGTELDESSSPHRRDEHSLYSVRTELAVAPVRDHVWPRATAVARCAAGYSADMLPVRLSDVERRAVLAIRGLSPGVRSALQDRGPDR